MYEAIEIVKAMYDAAVQKRNATPLYMMEDKELRARIETLGEVLYALKVAREQK